MKQLSNIKKEQGNLGRISMEKIKKKIDIKRITSALLGFPLVVLVLTLGNKYVVDVFLAIIAAIAMQEYLNAISKDSKPIRWIGYISCILIASFSHSHIIMYPNFWMYYSCKFEFIINLIYYNNSHRHENQF